MSKSEIYWGTSCLKVLVFENLQQLKNQTSNDSNPKGLKI